MTDHAERFWDRVATVTADPQKPLGRTERDTIESVIPHLSPTSVVLDVGCGPGELTLALSAHVRSVHAIDTSTGMVGATRERVRVHAVPNVTCDRATLDDGALRPGSFTAVTMFNTLHYVDDVSATVRRIHALLAPGGVFLSATACLAERISFLGLVARALSTLRVMPPARAFRRAELENHITGGGFTVVESAALSTLPDWFIAARRAD